MKKTYFENLTESWELLAKSERNGKPVCIYGMGDACERLLDEFSRRNIRCSAIFASDDFVRGQEFCGYRVEKLSALEERFGDFTVCCAFGSSLPDTMSHICDIAARHTLVYPDLPVSGEGMFSKAEFLSRFDEADSVCSILADEQSRHTFAALFAFKITGDISHLLPVFTDCDAEFSRIISPKKDEVYADLGAYTGDTAQRFMGIAGGYEHIYLFEPDKRSFRKCVKNLITHDKITFVNACGWNCDTQLLFSQSAGRQSQISSAGTLTSARSLDSVLGSKRCSIIKYDVEGAESEALAGSSKTISAYQPRLVVSAYHRPFDLIDLPNEILRLNGKYKLYLRQPTYFPAWDSVFFAV